MRKDKLRSLRSLNATDKMLELAADNEYIKTYNGWDGREINEKRRKYALLLRTQQLKGITKIAVFLPGKINSGIKTPRWEIFIDSDREEFITRLLDDKGNETGWSSAMISNLRYTKADCVNTWSYYHYSDNYAWINPEGNQAIKRLHSRRLKGNEPGGYTGILRFQEKCRESERIRREKKETDPWDEDMKLIPKTPRGFINFVRRNDDNFIFYNPAEYKGFGYCSYCEDKVSLKVPPHHNNSGKCPVCHKDIQYKSTMKMASKINTDTRNFSHIQAIDGGYVIREYYAYKIIRRSSYKNPEYSLREHRRTLVRGDSIKVYEWGLYKNRYMRWIRRHYSMFGNDKSIIYTRNLNNLEKTALSRTALPIMIRLGNMIASVRYVTMEHEFKAMESLVKSGFTKLAIDMTKMSKWYLEDYVDAGQTELARFLKIDKSRLKRLKGIDGNMKALLWFQKEKEDNTIWPDEMIRFFSEKYTKPDDLDFISDRMSYVKIWHYLEKQRSISYLELSNLVDKWRDYLRMAEDAKRNVNLEQIYKPADLKKAHDDIIAYLQGESAKEEARKWARKYKNVNKICQTLKKYEFSDDHYSIVAPTGIIDIINEGKTLNHCVHTCDIYYDRINRRETYLLFLRKAAEPDRPWYTLEIEPHGQIRQKRTTGDNQNKDFEDAVPFLKKWQQEIQKRLSNEDKELGVKSDKARKKEYAKLRKDGNKIWHGRLAGQLLADVLEDDFMALEA